MMASSKKNQSTKLRGIRSVPGFRFLRRVCSLNKTNAQVKIQINKESLNISNVEGVSQQNKQECFDIKHLEELTQQKRNGDFKSIASNADRLDLIHIGGQTLMHTAAATSNIEIIAFLFSLGFDINAQNPLGQTPLHLALLNSQFQVMQLLLSLDANILIADSENNSTLQLCFQKERQVPEYIIVNVFERLKRTGLSPERMTDHLEKVGCSIHQVLLMYDAEVTGQMLDRWTTIAEYETRALLERSMTSDYTENIRALLNHGPEVIKRRNIFIEKVTTRRFDPDMKFYYEKLFEWDEMTKALLNKAAYTFASKNLNDMQIYFDMGIDDYARKNHGRELLVGLFGNKNVEIEDCINIVDNRQFDFNGIDMNGSTALHAAAKNGNKAGVVYLLNHDADPNIKDSEGRTPLFHCYRSSELAKLLVDAGTDIQTVDKKGKTVIDFSASAYILAKLAIFEAKGLAKLERYAEFEMQDKDMQYTIQPDLRQDIEWMKTQNILKSVTLFNVLVNVEITARKIKNLVKNEDDAVAILEARRGRVCHWIYRSMLKDNLKMIPRVCELHTKADEFLSNVMKIHRPDHLVIVKIVNFLTYQDLLVFDKIVA